MKLTSWAFLAFIGSLIFLVLFIKDQEVRMGVDRLRKLNASRQSVLDADPNLKAVSERSPYMRTERWYRRLSTSLPCRGANATGIAMDLHRRWGRDRGRGQKPPRNQQCVRIRSAALAGAGIIMQRRDLLANDIAEGHLKVLLSDYKTQPRPRHVVWLQNRRMTPKLRVFIDYIIKLYG
jgi:DNA-binding transcriptional LysR family regulator